MVDTCRTRLRKVKTIEVLQPFLKSPNPDIQIGALATLAGVIDEEESDIIKSNEESVIVLMDKLRQGLQAESRRSKGQSNWSCKECAMSKCYFLMWLHQAR